MNAKRWALTVFLSAALILGVGLTTRPAAAQQGTLWQASFYNNPQLAGTPVYSAQYGAVDFNWGLGSPGPGVPADNFSARFVTDTYLPAGTYRIDVSVDDGVRVYVDGALVLDQWHGAMGTPYSQTITLGAGQHVVTIEYYDATLNAYLTYSLTPVTVPAPLPAAGTATVLATRLNVRNAPDANTGLVVTQINQGETYTIVGRDEDGGWLQLDVNGAVGWVDSHYVSLNNTTLLTIPVTSTVSAPPEPPATGDVFTAHANLNIHSGPGLTEAIVGLLPVGQPAQVVGRTADAQWWQITYGTLAGWVSGAYGALQPGAAINLIPITG